MCTRQDKIYKIPTLLVWNSYNSVFSYTQTHMIECIWGGGLDTNRRRNSVTMHMRWGEATVPMKSKIFGCRSLFIRDVFKLKEKTVRKIWSLLTRNIWFSPILDMCKFWISIFLFVLYFNGVAFFLERALVTICYKNISNLRWERYRLSKWCIWNER